MEQVKSKSFKIIIFAISSALISFIVFNAIIKNDHNKKSNTIITNSKTDVLASKKGELIKQQSQQAEIIKQQQITQKQENLESLWKVGYDEFFKKNYTGAIEVEKKVLKEDANFYKAYAVLGIALAYNGEFLNGMQQIDKSLKIKPDYGYARFNKALANELYGHYDEAIKWYKKALDVEKFEWSYYGIASIYGRKADVKNTIKYLKLAIDINPSIKDAAKSEEDFDNVRQAVEFVELIKK